MGKFVVWMLARTPNSHSTPAHLPDVGGDTTAAVAHGSVDLIKGIENKWGKHERVQTVGTKRESESVHKFFKWSILHSNQ